MAQKREAHILRIVILVFGVISLVYGFFFMVVPGWYLNMIGESPVPLVNIRWSGGVLIALAYGAWKFYKDPAKGKAYAYTIAVAPLLGGSSLLYSLIASHNLFGLFGNLGETTHAKSRSLYTQRVSVCLALPEIIPSY